MDFKVLELLARFELATSSLPILSRLFPLVVSYRAWGGKKNCGAMTFPDHLWRIAVPC